MAIKSEETLRYMVAFLTSRDTMQRWIPIPEEIGIALEVDECRTNYEIIIMA